MDKTKELILLAQKGDMNAKEQLVKENIGLVWSIVKRFTNRGYEADDLFQIGSIGLIKCIDKFDMSFDVKFSTYAVPMIMGEIKRFLRDDGVIKVSRSLKEISTKAKYKQDELLQKTGKNPTMDELAAALDTNVEELVMAMESGMEVESLYQTVHHGEGNPVFLIDKLDQSQAHNQGFSDNMLDVIALKQIINQLNPKERQVIILRYFKDMTQTQVAEKIGVSQVQVSRIEKKVLENMKEKFFK